MNRHRAPTSPSVPAFGPADGLEGFSGVNVARTNAAADQPFKANDAEVSHRPEGCSTISVTARVVTTIGKWR